VAAWTAAWAASVDSALRRWRACPVGQWQGGPIEDLEPRELESKELEALKTP